MKTAQKTRVMVDDTDISNLVAGVNIPRTPGGVGIVQLEVFTDRLEIEEDGTLVIHMSTD